MLFGQRWELVKKENIYLDDISNARSEYNRLSRIDPDSVNGYCRISSGHYCPPLS